MAQTPPIVAPAERRHRRPGNFAGVYLAVQGQGVDLACPSIVHCS